MNVLLCGSTGFIGKHVLRALLARGHRVTACSAHKFAQANALSRVHKVLQIDFVHDVTVEAWLPRLQDIQAVVNCVGVLRDNPRRPMSAIHVTAPQALYRACAQIGLKRVVHVSALGIEGNLSYYARSKQETERFLLALNAEKRLDACIVRPSIVFGKGGDSSRLFMALAKLPLQILPEPVLRARVQPVAVQELAAAIAGLVEPGQNRSGLIECGGPTAVYLADFIQSLRMQMGYRRARVLRLPDLLTRMSVRMGDCIPLIPWCSETLAMLAQDNVTDPAGFADLLGHPAIAYDQLVSRAWH